MTDARMALLELIEKRADTDLVREMLAFAAARLMDLEVETLTGAPAGARSPERLNHRNGYRERAWLLRRSSACTSRTPQERPGKQSRHRQGCNAEPQQYSAQSYAPARSCRAAAERSPTLQRAV